MTVTASSLSAIRTHADGFGQWRAEVTLDPPLSKTDDRSEYSLAAQLPAISEAARRALIEELVQRHQLRDETEDQARVRLTNYLHNVKLIAEERDARGNITVLVLGE